MRYGAISDIGLIRNINEDNFYVCPEGDFPYAVVADGMGGHQAGEVASMMVVDILENHIENNMSPDMDYIEAGEVIRQAFMSANSIVYNYSKNHYKIMGMGTTTTLAMIFKEKLIVVHVGDSRAYSITDNEIKQITVDHSYVWELVKRGEITPEEAKIHPKKNYITRAMGAEEIVKADVKITDYNGEKILLCSDGLTNFVDDDIILEYMNRGGSLQDRVKSLVDLANENGGGDNVTVVVLEREMNGNE